MKMNDNFVRTKDEDNERMMMTLEDDVLSLIAIANHDKNLISLLLRELTSIIGDLFSFSK